MATKARKKKKKGINLQHFLTQKLRRISYTWPPRKESIVKSRVSRGKYRCASCLGENFGPTEINCDHILAVIDPHDGFIDFNTYIDRLFCDESGFQTLCKPCHLAKSTRENIIRSLVKHENKKDESDDF